MAAGLGTRFGSQTETKPKGFIEVCGKPMIIRAIDTLLECGIKRIIIGTGHHHEMYESLTEKYPMVQCCYSKEYAYTNSMWTLLNCRNLIGKQDFILLESDLVFEKMAITGLLENQHKNIMLCSDVTKFQDSYFIEYDDEKYLMNCTTNESELNVCGEMVGIHKIDYGFYTKLCEYYDKIKEIQPKMGYEYAMLHIAKSESKLFVLKIPELFWYEIDDIVDLRVAEKLLLTRRLMS